jgi:ThiF family
MQSYLLKQRHDLSTGWKAEIAWKEIVDRQTGLLTPEQNGAIRKTRLLMLGVGGMGMNAAANLVRAGFEKFTLVDFDTIDGTTANRTPFAFDDTLEMQKTEATRDYMLKVNPRAQIELHSGVRLGLDSNLAFMRELVEGHDVLSWAMDGIAGRIHYTRVAHEIGSGCPGGKPAVESWAVPFHFCVMTTPNATGTATWEECFNLPTAEKAMTEITQEEVVEAQKIFFAGFLQKLPGIPDSITPDLLERWSSLNIANRSFGPHVAGCAALIAYEIVKNALELAGKPLMGTEVCRAPWMNLYDTRRNTAYQYNFRTRSFRWRHPLSGELIEEL